MKAASGLGDAGTEVLSVSGAAGNGGSGIHTGGGWLRSFCEFPAAFPACFPLFLLSWSRGMRCCLLVGCAEKSQTQGLFKVQWDTLQEE